MAPRARAGTLKGVLIRPTISGNRRWYTKEMLIASAKDLQGRIDRGEAVMLTHHGAADDGGQDVVQHTAGRMTKVTADSDGVLHYEADVPDTTTGRDLIALAAPGGKGMPYVKGVSIRGGLLNRRVVTAPDGKAAETGDKLIIRGADFTHFPGVEGAGIDSAEAEESVAMFDVTEETEVTLVEEGTPPREIPVGPDGLPYGVRVDEANKEPYGNVTYADPGYQKDKKKRYPLDTKKHVRAAWAYINMPKNAKKYTSAQLRSVKGKIRSAAKKYGINVQEELESLEADLAPVIEAYASVSADNGDFGVSASTYNADPDQMVAVIRRLALVVMAGQLIGDPDMDGDLDLDDEEDEDKECSECGFALPALAKFCPECGAAVPSDDGESNRKEPTVGEEQKGANGTTEGAPAAGFDAAALVKQITEGVGQAVGTAVTEALKGAGIAPATESLPDTSNPEAFAAWLKEHDAGVVESAVTAMREQVLKDFGPPAGRKGLDPNGVDESEGAGGTTDVTDAGAASAADEPYKPLSDAEWEEKQAAKNKLLSESLTMGVLAESK